VSAVLLPPYKPPVRFGPAFLEVFPEGILAPGLLSPTLTATDADGQPLAYQGFVFARAWLTKAGWKLNANNVTSALGWVVAEGLLGVRIQSGWATNPLDSTQPWPGCHPVNSSGVMVYPSVSDGIDAELFCLTFPNNPWGYSNIVNAYRKSAKAIDNWLAVMASRWGTFRGENGDWTMNELAYLNGQTSAIVKTYN